MLHDEVTSHVYTNVLHKVEYIHSHSYSESPENFLSVVSRTAMHSPSGPAVLHDIKAEVSTEYTIEKSKAYPLIVSSLIIKINIELYLEHGA